MFTPQHPRHSLMSGTVAKLQLVKIPADLNCPGRQQGEQWPWGLLSAPGPKLWHTGAGGSQRHPATARTHGSSWEGLGWSGALRSEEAGGQPLCPPLPGQAAGSAGSCQPGAWGQSSAAGGTQLSSGGVSRGRGLGAGLRSLLAAVVPAHAIGATGGRCRRSSAAGRTASPGKPLAPRRATRRGWGCGAGTRPVAGSAAGDGRGRGGGSPPPVSPFSVSPARETLRWQSRAPRPSEVGGVWPSPALPPSIVSGGERRRRRRAPAPVPGGRDAPALRGGAGRLRQSRRVRSGAAAGSSRGPEEGDAACVFLAQLPPREVNMSLPGRVSCSMLNCFVSAAAPLPPLLPFMQAGLKANSLSSSCSELAAADQVCP